MNEKLFHLDAATLGRLRHLADKLAPLGHDMRMISGRFLHPVLSLDPGSLEKFIDANCDAFIVEYVKLIPKMVNLMDVGKVPELLELMQLLGKRLESSIFSEDILHNFKEALLLESDNALYMMRKYGKVLPELSAILGTNNIELDRLLRTAARLSLAMWALPEGLASEKKELEPTLRALSKLCLRYAEEHDAQITTIDVVIDQQKRSDLEQAYQDLPRQ